MRRSLWIFAIVVLLTLATALQAWAVYDEDNTSRLSVMLGLYRPSSSELRKEGDSAWKTLGVNYLLSDDQQKNFRKSVSVELANNEHDRLRGSLFSVQYSGVWRKHSPEEPGPYYGAGGGIFLAREKLKAKFVSGVGVLPEVNHSGTKLGFSLTGGYDFNQHWFAEMRYTKVGKISGDLDFSGLTFYAGGRLSF